MTIRADIQQHSGHPAERHFTVRDGNLWVSECVITYEGVPTYSLSVMEISDGLVTHETQYFADPFPAAPTRTALAESIRLTINSRATAAGVGVTSIVR